MGRVLYRRLVDIYRRGRRNPIAEGRPDRSPAAALPSTSGIDLALAGTSLHACRANALAGLLRVTRHRHVSASTTADDRSDHGLDCGVRCRRKPPRDGESVRGNVGHSLRGAFLDGGLANVVSSREAESASLAMHRNPLEPCRPGKSHSFGALRGVRCDDGRLWTPPELAVEGLARYGCGAGTAWIWRISLLGRCAAPTYVVAVPVRMEWPILRQPRALRPPPSTGAPELVRHTRDTGSHSGRNREPLNTFAKDRMSSARGSRSGERRCSARVSWRLARVWFAAAG